jgi:hypothetical protein
MSGCPRDVPKKISAAEVSTLSMLDDLRDTLALVLLVDVSATEEDALRKGNKGSLCISYDSTARDGRDPFRPDLGFRSMDDFRAASKRVDLVFFGSRADPWAMATIIHRFLQSDGIVAVGAGSASVSPPEISRGLGAIGCEGGCVLTVRETFGCDRSWVRSGCGRGDACVSETGA